ncbi:hypothetical protein [Phaeobacter phage MD18]|nr:hypothetical protein [Phaeobacter phage MD18]
MNKEKYWIKTKGGYFYRPGSRGYTASLEEAGLFSKDSAMDSDRHCEEVRVMPYLVALHGTANLRYDWEIQAYWHVDTRETWAADTCSMEPHMVQHRRVPEPDPHGIPSAKDPRVLFRNPHITAAGVREYRDKTGRSMMEAKVHLIREQYEKCMAEFRAEASVEDKLDFILDWITDREMGR